MEKFGGPFLRLMTARKKMSPLEALRSTILFDPSWYQKNNADLQRPTIDPAKHYLEHGAREGRNPHPLFDTKWYLNQNEDVARANINPLYHYIQYGWQERRNPHPLFEISWYQ